MVFGQANSTGQYGIAVYYGGTVAQDNEVFGNGYMRFGYAFN